MRNMCIEIGEVEKSFRYKIVEFSFLKIFPDFFCKTKVKKYNDHRMFFFCFAEFFFLRILTKSKAIYSVHLSRGTILLFYICE